MIPSRTALIAASLLALAFALPSEAPAAATAGDGRRPTLALVLTVAFTSTSETSRLAVPLGLFRGPDRVLDHVAVGHGRLRLRQHAGLPAHLTTLLAVCYARKRRASCSSRSSPSCSASTRSSSTNGLSNGSPQ